MVILSLHRRRANVLGPKAETDEPGWNPTQDGKSLQESHGQWKLRAICRREHWPHDVVLHKELHPLGGGGGELPPLLDPAQVVDGRSAVGQGGGEDIGGRYCVLDRQVDSDASNG